MEMMCKNLCSIKWVMAYTIGYICLHMSDPNVYSPSGTSTALPMTPQATGGPELPSI